MLLAAPGLASPWVYISTENIGLAIAILIAPLAVAGAVLTVVFPTPDDVASVAALWAARVALLAIIGAAIWVAAARPRKRGRRSISADKRATSLPFGYPMPASV